MRVLTRFYVSGQFLTGGIAEHNQTIKVLDTTAPTFGAIDDLNESTTTNSCEANVVLPVPAISDDCSSETSYTASATSGTLLPANGGYVLYGLAIGTHTVIYEATDDCGNTSTISFDITVTDQIVPVTICEFNLKSIFLKGCKSTEKFRLRGIFLERLVVLREKTYIWKVEEA